MSGECEKCGEHALECTCAKCSIDKAAERNKQIKTGYWISVEDELPPCDGLYQVTNCPEYPGDKFVLPYDGIGFLYEHAYRPVKFWRHYLPLPKRYGKVK